MQPLFLIFDLNGTLLSYHHKTQRSDHPEWFRKHSFEELPLAEWTSYVVHLRNHLTGLLDFLFEQHPACHLAVWSFSGKNRASVQKLSEIVFGQYISRLEFIWSKYEAVRGKKCLEQVWESYPHWIRSRTLLIEDSMHKSCHREHTLVIPSFDFRRELSCKEEMRDTSLLDLVETLRRLQ